MTWQTLAFFLVASAAFGYSGYRFWILFRLMKAHQAKAYRLNEIGARIGTALANVLGQKAVLRKNPIGIAHTMIFWGFLIITVGTLEQFVSTIYEPANFQFIGETAYSILVFFQDLFTLLVFVGVGYACYRRFIVRPEGVGKSRDANIVLAFTGSLMIAIFLMNGFHILGRDPWYQNAMPFSHAIAKCSERSDFSQQTNINLGTFFKWVHMLIVLGFAVYIPSSKHLHIVAAIPNTFLRTLPREKGMKPINFEDESVTQYGTGKITDLSWKDALDYYSCTECGRCQDLCPAHNTQKPLTPKMLIIDLKENLYKNKPASSRQEVRRSRASDRRERHGGRDLGLYLLSCLRDRLSGLHRTHG